ncbi:MAG: hypothetical protein A2W01_04370 [Candidatus Solincola sediminis]|nr:MAG: hypothetical protein A2W01_04370 [Candidatus Solincola sediminis]
MEGDRSEDFGQTGELSPAGANFELDAVVGIFARLSIACKSRSLYPADHPAVREAIHILFSIIEEALVDNPIIEVQVIRDNLVYKDWHIGKQREGLKQLASRIRDLNIQEITLEAGVSKAEVESFVNLLISDPAELEIEGGVENYSLEKGWRCISIVESSAQLADYEAPTEEVSNQIRTIAPLNEEADVRLNDDRLQDMEALLEIIFNPMELAGLLMQLPGEDGLPLDDPTLADVIFDFMKERSEMIITAYPELAEKCMRSLAEALLYFRTDLRNQLLFRRLLKEIGDGPFCGEIIRQFSAQEISDILCHFFPLAPELVPETPDMLSKAGFEKSELDKALDLLRNRLIDLGEVSPALIASLKTGGDATSEPQALPSLEEISAYCSKYGVEEMEAIKRISEMDLNRESLLGTTPMLLDLVNKGLRLDNLGRAVELLKNHFWEFLASGELEYATVILVEIKPLLKNHDPAFDAFRAELSQMIEQAGSPKILRDTVKLACERRIEDYRITEDFKSYISQLEEGGTVGLLEALGSEEDMTLRKYIIDILGEGGLQHLHILGRYLDDPRWYLVRNIVTIMAGLHSSETIPYLRLTFSHPNPKVRAETVRALGLTGGYEPGRMIIQGLEDPDESIRLLCIRWLGRLGEEKAVGRLVKMLEDREPGAESLAFKKEIIASLGEIMAPDSYQALKRFSSKQKMMRRAEWREINEAAGAALAGLVKKYPNLEERR